MSRLGEQLQRLHKPASSLGFGFSAATVQKRRMLLVVRVESPTDEKHLAAVASIADAVVIAAEAGEPKSVIQTLSAQRKSIPVGVWQSSESSLSIECGESWCDFLVCTVQASIEAVGQKRGCVVRVDADTEASRLRAIGEIGTDAILLAGDALDLTRLSALVEARRVRLSSGKPVLLHVSGVLEPSQLVALWRVGVDGLVVDLSLGTEKLESTRTAIDQAPFDARIGSGAGSPVIGAHVGSLSQPEVSGGDDGGEEDDDEDDE